MTQFRSTSLSQCRKDLAIQTPMCDGSWMACVTTPSFSIAINGSLHGFCKGKRGLRQGDPMSPFLFMICLEYLSRLLKLKTTESDFNFHPKCDVLNISHIFFADDLMLFCRGDTPYVKILVDALTKLSHISGLQVNAVKSSIFTAGIFQGGTQEIHEIYNIVGCPEGTLPVRYLGIPLASQRLNVVHYSPFVACIAKYISSWTDLYLSYVGKLEVIHSVTQGEECRESPPAPMCAH